MKTLVLSVVAIVLSVFSIVLYFFKFSPVEVDAIGYIGVIGAFITISITVLVGFQIYRAYEIKRDLNDLKASLAEVERVREALTKFEHESRGNFHLIVGGIFAKENSACEDSFLNILESINYFLKCEYDKMDLVLEDLKESILNLQPGYFATGTETQVDDIIDGINKRAGVIEQKIIANTNYYTIRYRFEKIMKAYYERTDNCRRNITVTNEETQNLRNI